MQIRCNFPDISYVSETQNNNFQFLNNNPLTKNKPIYHAKISEQMKWRGFPKPFICLPSERDKSVYFWPRGSYLLYNATIVGGIQQKPNKRGDPHSAIMFILSTATRISPLTVSSNIAATAKHFVV